MQYTFKIFLGSVVLKNSNFKIKTFQAKIQEINVFQKIFLKINLAKICHIHTRFCIYPKQNNFKLQARFVNKKITI